MTAETTSILIVEDGNEYLANLQAFLPDFRYIQAHCAANALEIIKNQSLDLLFLDMRFDRCDRRDLLGDPKELLDGFTLTEQEAWSFIENNQGLYIYRAVRDSGYYSLPALISYDFSLELARWQVIASTDSCVDWIADTATADSIQRKIHALIRNNSIITNR